MPEKEPENSTPKEAEKPFDPDATGEFVPLPEDTLPKEPSEILKVGRENIKPLLEPLNEKIKQLKKEAKKLKDEFPSSFRSPEQINEELIKNEEEVEKIKKQKEEIEDKIKQEIINRKKNLKKD